MRYKKSIAGFYLLSCSFYVVFAEDDFSKIEKEMQNNPPGVGHPSDTSAIYSKATKNIVNKAIENHSLEDIVSVESEADEFNPYLKLNKEGIQVYIFSRKNSDFATFKAVTHINASLDSVLAVMMDNNSCRDWVDACENSFVIKNISFNERYHYQVFDIPLPFINRDFIFHSIMTHDPANKTVTINMFSEADFCNNNESEACQKVNQSKLVRVKKSTGTFKLQADDDGIKITWIQHTDPAGFMPGWLVNQFVKSTPYWTFKNLKKIVEEEKYKKAKLVYNSDGIAIALNVPLIKSKKPARIVQDLKLHSLY